MTISQIFSDRIEAFLHLERFVNKGSPSGFSDQNMPSLGTRPQDNEKDFGLPCLVLKNDRIVASGDVARISDKLTGDGELVVYPMHPDIASQLLTSNGVIDCFEIRVIPTASMRTVFHRQCNGDGIFIKLDYPSLIGRFNRANTYPKWISSFENNIELKNAVNSGSIPDCFGFMDEFAGHFINRTEDAGYSGGVIYREMGPFPQISGSCDGFLIPFFSLFSLDVAKPDDPFLLTQIIGQSNHPLEFVCDQVLEPLLTCFGFQANELGFLAEYNAQNTMLEIDSQCIPRRIIHRDMMGTFKDFDVRRSKGLSVDLNPYHSIEKHNNPKEYYRRRSFAYDFKLGEYILTEIESVLESDFGVGTNLFRSRVKGLFKETIETDTVKFFGSNKHWTGYDKVLPHGGQPYIKFESPKYR